MNRPKISDIKKELEVSTARSGGPGGQHVNKVETKVVLKWNVQESKVLTDLQKEMIISVLGNKLTKAGELVITADNKRSQLKNKELAFKKLDRLITKSFIKKKKRKPTQPTKAAKKKRLENKKKHSEKKALRKRID